MGAVGEYGSIAIIERLVRSLKEECTRQITVPVHEDAMRTEMTCYTNGYNQHRPHQSLGGRVPMDVYSEVEEETPYFETRGQDVGIICLVVKHIDDRMRLPIVELKHAA